MEIKVYGTGCPKCKSLYRAVEGAIAESGRAARLSKVEEIEAIMAAGVLRTPALEVDGKVLASGRVPDSQELLAWIKGGA